MDSLSVHPQSDSICSTTSVAVGHAFLYRLLYKLGPWKLIEVLELLCGAKFTDGILSITLQFLTVGSLRCVWVGPSIRTPYGFIRHNDIAFMAAPWSYSHSHDDSGSSRF